MVGWEGRRAWSWWGRMVGWYGAAEVGLGLVWWRVGCAGAGGLRGWGRVGTVRARGAGAAWAIGGLGGAGLMRGSRDVCIQGGGTCLGCDLKVAEGSHPLRQMLIIR